MHSTQLVPPERAIAADPAASVLDAEAIARLAELDPKGELQLLQRVMKTFHASALRMSAQLDAARATDDRTVIRLVAHTLKSSSGYIGALQLARCCAELEAASTRADGADLSSELDAMIDALALTLEAVTRRLGGA